MGKEHGEDKIGTFLEDCKPIFNYYFGSMMGIPVLLLAMIAASQQTGNQALSFIVSKPTAKGQGLFPSGYNTPTAYDDLKAEITAVEGKDRTQLAATRRLEA